jgi:hypothetical protein
MTAKLDGTAWTADPLIAGQGAIHANPGFYLIPGYKLISSTNAQFLTLIVYNVTGTGTYPLGVTPQVFGGVGEFGDATSAWITPLTRMAGTFEFKADAVSGSAAGVRNVTEGHFDFPVITQGTVGPLPDNAGGRISATLGGTYWNGSTAQAQITSVGGSNVLIMGGLSTTGHVNITISGVTGPGTYPLNNTGPTCMLTANDAATGYTWGGTISFPGGVPTTNDVGSIIITSLTATRVKGTFTGTLAPGFGSGAPGSLAVTGGDFDIGFP